MSRGAIYFQHQANDMELMGEMMRRTRKQHGLSMDDVSYLSGVSETAIAQMERGAEFTPSLRTVALTLPVYGLKFADLDNVEVFIK